MSMLKKKLAKDRAFEPGLSKQAERELDADIDAMNTEPVPVTEQVKEVLDVDKRSDKSDS